VPAIENPNKKIRRKTSLLYDTTSQNLLVQIYETLFSTAEKEVFFNGK
jgi:hypothetical protein